MKNRAMAALCAVLMTATACGGAPVYMTESELNERASELAAAPVETAVGTDALTDAASDRMSETAGKTTPAPTTEAATEPTTAPTTEATTEETTEATTEETTEPTTEAAEWDMPTDGTSSILNGCLVVNQGTDHARAIELFGGNHSVSSRYAGVLDQYQQALGDDVQVWCMVVPTSQAFYTPEEFASKNGDQRAEYENVAASLTAAKPVPVYDALYAHRGEATYSRTDYHWQPLGAYYAAEQFAKVAGVPYAKLSTYEAVEREGYVGAFAAVNKIGGLSPETFTYYKPANLDSVECTYYNVDFTNARSGKMFHEDNSIGASYTVFIGTDECIFEADVADAPNDRVLVIMKDSYGNALVPFLTQSFSKIYLTDFRYFQGSLVNFCQNVGATDVLFALSSVAVTTSNKVDQAGGHF